ncbi:MAG: hypothetical protein ACLFSI_02650 [Halorhodospira sp.]
MVWTKSKFRGFNVNFLDPINSIVNSFVQSGVLAGPHYSASEVSYGLPKPKFLQIEEESDEVTIKTETGFELVLCFALGLQSDSDGNEGQWRNLIRVIDPDQDGDGSVTLSESSYIVAVLDEEEEPYPVSYKAISAEGREFYWQRSEPDSPNDGDFWFSVDENWIKEWDDGAAEWKERRYVFLGKVGVGSDGYCYSALSWFPNKRVAEVEADKYPHGENPWSHYDGVSFTTDGEYVASQADQWADDQSVAEAVAANEPAMNALVESETGMEAVAASETAMDEIAASSMARPKVYDSFTARKEVASNETSLAKILAAETGLTPSDVTSVSEIASDSDASSSVAESSKLTEYVLFGQALPDFLSEDRAEDFSPDNYGDNDDAICVRAYGFDDTKTEEVTLKSEIDLSDYSTLKFTWRNEGADSNLNDSRFKINDEVKVAESNQFESKTESVDISETSGKCELSFEAEDSDSSDPAESKIYVEDIWLEE